MTLCVDVIQRFGGYIAQYLGDGLLVYFGCPQAHEDDAQRAIRAGLGIVEAMETRNAYLEQHDERWWEAEVSRLRGVLLLRQTGTSQAEAEAWLQRALDVVRRQ